MDAATAGQIILSDPRARRLAARAAAIAAAVIATPLVLLLALVVALSSPSSPGTVGSADCGDMLRMWIKFKEQNGRKVIDRATFQSFGCQTAIAVASYLAGGILNASVLGLALLMGPLSG